MLSAILFLLLFCSLLAIPGFRGAGQTNHRLVYLGSAGAAFATAGIALLFLLTAPQVGTSLLLPWGFWSITFHLDPLAAYFLLAINTVSGITSIYSLGYAGHHPDPRRVQGFYPLFLVAMNGVLLAGDIFSFLLAWEIMSITSWLLVLANHHESGNGRPAHIYLLMAAFGALTLLAAFALLAQAGGAWSFALIREQIASHPLTPWIKSAIILLTLLGAGSKAGIFPLHVWLPLAHPAAPSHVSALMSGIMTKVAIYGLVRILFDLLGGTPSGWAVAITLLGAVTAVFGVLYALMQHDLKKLLAYHTVENIGIIVAGLGIALLFQAEAHPLLAALALTAALLHVFNHALFKSLLFCGAGAVLLATGERDMEHQGGLIHRLPQTAFFFLLGAAAISALPPFNGFVSEWLTFQAILQTPVIHTWSGRLAAPLTGILLMSAAAMAVACFVKVYGVVFLGRPRSAAAAKAQEVAPSMRWAMGLLAGLCLLFGLFPMPVMELLRQVSGQLLGEALPPALTAGYGLILQPVSTSKAAYSGALLLLLLLGSAGVVHLLLRHLAHGGMRRTDPWDCGFPQNHPATQYTADSFAQPIRRVYATTLFHAREHLEMAEPDQIKASRFSVTMRDPAWQWIFTPIAHGVQQGANRCNVMQFLPLRLFLVMSFVTLIFLLSLAAISQ